MTNDIDNASSGDVLQPLTPAAAPPPDDELCVARPEPYERQTLTTAQAAEVQTASLAIQADEYISRRAAAGLPVDAWQAYRDALDAVPAQSGYPLEIVWPFQPAA